MDVPTNIRARGGVAERFKAPVLKTGVEQSTVGSNPTPTATTASHSIVCEFLRSYWLAKGKLPDVSKHFQFMEASRWPVLPERKKT